MPTDWDLGLLRDEMQSTAPAPSWSALAQREGHEDCGRCCPCWARAHREEYEARYGGRPVVRVDWLRLALLAAIAAALLLAGRWTGGR